MKIPRKNPQRFLSADDADFAESFFAAFSPPGLQNVILTIVMRHFELHFFNLRSSAQSVDHKLSP